MFWVNFSKDLNNWLCKCPLTEMVLIFLSLHILFSLLKQTGGERNRSIKNLLREKYASLDELSQGGKSYITLHVNVH